MNFFISLLPQTKPKLRMTEDFETFSEYLDPRRRYRQTIPLKDSESEEDKRRKRKERRRERMQDLQDILANWLITTLLLILCLILVTAMFGGIAMACGNRTHCDDDDDVRTDSIPTRTPVPTPHVNMIPMNGKLMPIVTAY